LPVLFTTLLHVSTAFAACPKLPVVTLSFSFLPPDCGPAYCQPDYFSSPGFRRLTTNFTYFLTPPYLYTRQLLLSMLPFTSRSQLELPAFRLIQLVMPCPTAFLFFCLHPTSVPEAESVIASCLLPGPRWKSQSSASSTLSCHLLLVSHFLCLHPTSTRGCFCQSLVVACRSPMELPFLRVFQFMLPFVGIPF
jgi:hypothetical protein